MTTRAGVYYMRAAAATGALYPIELYAACTDIPGLAAGVYHFNPLAFGLVRLREGDYTAWLADASGRTGLVSPITLAFTSIAWRNAWKYEARSYRHWFWDSGVIVANLLATSSAENIPVQIDTGFVDSKVSSLLGLADRKEAPVALAHIGAFENAVGESQRVPPNLSQIVKPLSREETAYPIIWETNSTSELHNSTEVRSWREAKPHPTLVSHGKGPLYTLKTLKPEDSVVSLDKTILKRGSTRRFTPKSIPLAHLSTILNAASSPVPADWLQEAQSLIKIFFIANQIDGLPSGSYLFDEKGEAVEQLKAGRFRDMSSYLCLDQPLFGDASTVFFLMADLDGVTAALGNRGYRTAQLEAGVRAGKIYLSSYALGNGASGSTFFDDAVTEFFSPEAKGLNTMIAVGVGVPAYTARPGKILFTA